jgi:DNA-binding HxlR family transcriptional regulator
LFSRKEARFGQFVDELGVPEKTLAVRLDELLHLGVIKRQVRQEGKNGVGFHIYMLTNQGEIIAREIGHDLASRLVKVEQDLTKVEQKISQRLG